MEMNYIHLLLWSVILIVLVIIEIVTINIVTAWFVIGSIFALFSTFFTRSINVQTIVFLVTSFASVFFLTGYLEKITKFKKTKTNISSIIGRICIVTKEINNVQNVGEVNLDNNLWSALSENELETISVGSKVQVISIKGVKLIVKKL